MTALPTRGDASGLWYRKNYENTEGFWTRKARINQRRARLSTLKTGSAILPILNEV